MKNYAAAYNDVNDSSALDQRFYLIAEGVKGVLTAPLNNSFLYTKSGGSITFTQAFNSSTHRSGRHNNNTIREKKSTEWSFSTMFNIDTLAANGAASIDPAVKLLFKSLLGREQAASTVIYDAAITPSYYFSLFEVGDRWAKISRGAWVNSCKLSFPGDGQASMDWSGNAFDSVLVGIGKSITTNAGNTVTVQTGEGKRFPVGSLVMIIKTNGTTRSADTPLGLPRRVVSVAGDVVLLDGAVLADADGSSALSPVYLCYYEPAAPTAIDNPLVGLEGSFTADQLPLGYCLRKLELDINNNHEIQNYCFGHDGIEGFVPGGRLNVGVSADLNFSSDLLEFYNAVTEQTPSSWELVLGSATGRRFIVTLPKIIFQVPSITIPESGSIPVTFSGTAYQTVLDAADEITLTFA